MGDIFIQKERDIEYPGCEYGYSPSEAYPEYRFPTVAGAANPVYDMVRKCLLGLGLDEANYGMAGWNPLGGFIRENDTVLIKPNMVFHENPGGTMDCLVTHPAVVRAVTDYVLIALNGTGKIIIGDAPMQSCDFQGLLRSSHLDSVSSFYRDNGIDVVFRDFRGIVSERAGVGVLRQRKNPDDALGAVCVDLGEDSAFSELPESRLRDLRITNYDPAQMNRHHYAGTHEYLISEAAIRADVIIDLPKPKTHRKAGVTGAMKNFVGVNANKDWLPHHTKGARESGGDEYPYRNRIRAAQTAVHEKIDCANCRGDYRAAAAWRLVLYAVCAIRRLVMGKRDNRISEGSWSGNDTIWRTVCDLNRILLYADKNGIMRETPQRTLFTLADMIYVGEGEGPLSPTPRYMGVIMAGFDAWALDRAVVSLFGVNGDLIPTVKNAGSGTRYRLTRSECVIRSNDVELSGKRLEEISYSDRPHIKMPSGWRDV